MHSKVKNYSLVFCLFVFLVRRHRRWPAHEPGRCVARRSERHSIGDLCLQSQVQRGLPARACSTPTRGK